MKQTKEKKATDLTFDLMSLEVAQIKWYYNKQKPIGTLYTVCLLLDIDSNILSRGVSICSMLDTYVKSTGKNKAFGRAVKALKNKESSFPLRTSKDPFRNKELIRKVFNCNSERDDIESIEKFLRDNAIVLNKNVNEQKNLVSFRCNIPHTLPMIIAAKRDISFLSAYKPDQTEEEKGLIEKLKEQQK